MRLPPVAARVGGGAAAGTPELRARQVPRGAGLGGGAVVPRLEAAPRGGRVVVAVALGAGVHQFFLAAFAVELHDFFGRPA